MQENRLKTIMRASIVGIATNIALGAFKAFVGLLTHSVAITMDAINNFTDAASSFITILATTFSSKSADRKHPFGYGRMEYLGTLLIGGLILYAGVTALVESVKKIINPEVSEYTTVALVIVIVAVLVKIALTIYVVKTGQRVKSDSLIASGKEAIGDVAISIATILAAVVYMAFNISLEAWLGAIIAIVIIKAGIETLKETIGKILGEPTDVALVKSVKAAIAAHEGVHGAYDLIMHDYGPDAYIASVHIAVDDTLALNDLDTLSRQIEDDILEQFGVFLSAIGIYSVNSTDPETINAREAVSNMVMQNDYVNQMHGFYFNTEKKQMRFDLVISLDAGDRIAVYKEVVAQVQAAYPDYALQIGMDTDYNELQD